MASMRGFSASVRRLVKAGETSARSRRWITRLRAVSPEKPPAFDG
jgi:hypothetical protein